MPGGWSECALTRVGVVFGNARCVRGAARVLKRDCGGEVLSGVQRVSVVNGGGSSGQELCSCELSTIPRAGSSI